MNDVNKYFVDIIGNKIDSEHIQRCIDIIEEIKTNNPENPVLLIEAKVEITAVDFSIIGHLILFKNAIQKHINKDLKISFYLPYNKTNPNDFEEDYDAKDRSIIWKLRQQMIHSYYSMNQNAVFDIIDGDGVISNASFMKNKWFVLSKKFLPVLFVNKNNYDSLFEKSLIQEEIHIRKTNLSKSQSNEEKLYQACRKFLFKKKRNDNYLQILAQLAFYSSLQATKILRFYLHDQLSDDVKYELNTLKDKEDIRVGNIQDNETKKKYREVVIPIFDELKTKPPFYQIVFFALISSELITNFETSEANIQSNKIQNLWEFTKELVYGLRELAKNIVEHSSEKEGIISGFVNEKNEFEINIFDHGNQSILQTFIQDTEKSFNSTDKRSILNKLFKDDLYYLKSGDFNFDTLVDIKSKKILNQQTKRATAHLGLLIYNRIIEDNKGCLFISSYDSNLKKPESFSTKKDIMPDFLSKGTSFKTILPIFKDKEYKPYKKINSPIAKNQSDLSSIQRLLNFQFISLNEKVENFIIEDRKNVLLSVSLTHCISDDHFEDSIWNSFFNFFTKIDLSKITKNSNVIICIGFEENENINASQLFRFLGKVDLYFPSNNLVIYDITTELYFELTKINRAMFDHFGKVLPYWNQDIFTIIYSFYYNDNKTEKFYFTDILWGKKLEDFLYINSLLKQTNHNALAHHPDFDIEIISNYKAEMPNESPLFFEKKTLIPFDLVIKTNKGLSIFEENSLVLINNEIKILRTNEEDKDEIINETRHIKKQIENLPGFRISKSHYRLGSKIHISDFFYAKRFFQNSFYASRFAFIVTNYIIKSFPEEKIKDLTLIGYGLYSELLVSIISTFLNKHFNDKAKINHNLINDIEKISLIKNYIDLNTNIIIITPIASTFSTSIKIEEFFIHDFNQNQNNDFQIKKSIEILSPHINLLLVSDGKVEDKVKINETEKKHGWVKIDSIHKIIQVKSFFDNSQRDQKYFLSMPSEWHSIDNCEICFPKVYKDCEDLTLNCKECKHNGVESYCLLTEKCLHVTDKTSVTPALLFDFPTGKKLSNGEIKRNFILSVDSLEYGHSTRNNDCFHYHLYDERFLRDNNDLIDEWLKLDVSYKLKEKELKETDNVLLFAPEHYSNTVFINIINQKVFSNSATILHYDVWNNNISNFRTFYQDFVNTFDKIYFVDDSIISGGAFLKASDFIKNTFTRKNRNYIFDGSFILINRTTKYIQDNISGLLLGNNNEYFFSFANLNLPSAKAYDTKCQLCMDFVKSKNLFEEAYLDRFKNHFYKRYMKLAPNKLTSDSQSNKSFKQNPSYNSKQNLIKIETTHRLFDYFINENNRDIFNDTNINFRDWQNHFINNSNSPFKTSKIEVHKNELFPLSEDTCVLFKVLVLHPFNLHKPIKERVFYWTNWLLNEFVEKYKNKRTFSISEIRDLKFLIRRAGLLNSNYIISKRFLSFIFETMSKIMNENFIDELVEKVKSHEIEIEELNTKRTQEIEKLKETEKKKTEKKKGRKENSTNIKIEINSQMDINIGELNNKLNIVEIEKKYFEDIIEIIENFPTYIVAQIIELLYQNEAKSILIEERILPFYNSSPDYSEVKQLFRMILEENGVLINSFWKSVSNELIEYSIPRLKNGHNFEIWNEDDFINIIKKKQNQFSELKSFFNIVNNGKQENDTISENLLFRRFLDLKTLLTIESDYGYDGISTQSLVNKTNRICKKIESLFFDSEKTCKAGSFLIVKYKEAETGLNYNANENMFLAYNEGYLKEISEQCLDENNNFITGFIEGKKNFSKNNNFSNHKNRYNATIDMLRKERKNNGSFEWKSEYAKPDGDIKIDFLKECEDVNYVLLLRFSEKSINDFYELKKDSQGVLVLYSDKNVFNYNRNRYLLLLRSSINNFLKKHHKNDEFRDLFEANNKSQHIRSFSHNIEMYYNMIDQINETSIIDPSLFKIFFTLLLNKNMILKVISDYENSNSKDLALRSNRITEECIEVDVITVKIKKYVHEIFSFEHEIYPQINETFYKLKFIVHGQITSLNIYNHFFDEVIFEIIYNIRRTYYNYLEDYINDLTPLIIKIIISENDIQIQNSHADNVITENEVLILNRRIKNKYKKKGLNLINSLSMILYNKPCHISLINNYFSITIPLKLIKYENSNN